jgi:membrane protein implicated in regulation of membrane protease activity
VEKSNRVQLVYGYTVCVIAVVTFLICASVLVNNVFDLANPIAAGGAFGSSLSSFDAYQATTQRTATAAPASAAQPDTASAATLRKRFDALRADRISRVSFEAWKAIVTSGLLLIISIALFILHWRWMKRLGAAAEAGTA